MRNHLYRLSGAALIGSFVLSLAGGMAHPIVDGRSHSAASLIAPASPYAQLLIYAGAVLLMLGLPAAFVYLAPHVGKIGMIGLVGYFLGNATSVQGHLVVEAFVAPAIARDPAAQHLIADDGTIIASGSFAAFQMAGGLIFMVSLLLIGVGLLRSRVVPKWIGVLAAGGALLLAVPLPETPVLTGLQIEFARGLTVAAIGVLMIRAARRRTVPAPAPAPASTILVEA
jgi:hypothetical protein